MKSELKGSSLIEVLVALLIFSSVLLAMIGTLLNCIRINRESFYYLQALTEMNSINEKLHLQKYFIHSDETNQFDLASWRLALSKNLPNGQGMLTFNKEQANITITWAGAKKQYNLASTVNLSLPGQVGCYHVKSVRQRGELS